MNSNKKKSKRGVRPFRRRASVQSAASIENIARQEIGVENTDKSDSDYIESDSSENSNVTEEEIEERKIMPAKKRKTNAPKKISQNVLVIHSSPEPEEMDEQETAPNISREEPAPGIEEESLSAITKIEEEISEIPLLLPQNEPNVLAPNLFPPDRGFEYKVGTKIDAQDELKKW